LKCFKPARHGISKFAHLFVFLGSIGHPIPFQARLPVHHNHHMKPVESHKKAPRNLFSPVEDERLRELVQLHGTLEWETIAQEMPGRTKRQCKERWRNYLSPEISLSTWTPAEDKLLLTMVEKLGNHWKSLEELFPGRSDNALKNRCRLLLRQQSRGEGRPQIKSTSSDQSTDVGVEIFEDDSWDILDSDSQLNDPGS
jgi:hypothetical protein